MMARMAFYVHVLYLQLEVPVHTCTLPLHCMWLRHLNLQDYTYVRAPVQ
jgi:hypothetical protein